MPCARVALRPRAVELGERLEAGGAGGLEVAGHGLDVAHDAQRVAADELRDVGLGPRPLEQGGDEPRVAADVLEPDREGVGAVVVAADADVVDAGDLAHVLEVGDDLLDRRVGLGVLALPRRR